MPISILALSLGGFLPTAVAFYTTHLGFTLLSSAALFGEVVYSAVTLVGDWRTSGRKMVVIGLGAAGVGFLIGNLFHAAGG